MKIAIVRKRYNPFGGAERYLNLLAAHLHRQGHEVHIFANRWADNRDERIIFHKVSMLGGLSLLKIWSFAAAACFALRQFRGDIILSNERLFSQDIFRASDGVHRTWLKIRMKHLSPVKKISILINPLHWSVRFFDWYIFNRRAFRKIIAPSEFIKQDILNTYHKVRQEDISVIYNGVDLERFRPENKKNYRDAIRNELNLAPSTWLLLFVGTGFERKGLRYAIEALRYLPPDTILAVIGKGKIRRYMTLARRWNLQGRVKFLGPVEGVERYYAAADLLISPTLYEPMANVVLEALATGIPVVTSRDSGNAEIVTEGVDGWLINNPTDALDISMKIEAAIKKARESITEIMARKKAEHFPLQRTLKEIINVVDYLNSATSNLHNLSMGIQKAD